MKFSEAISIIGCKSKDELKSCYRQKCFEYHPDRQNGNLDMMKIINLAYECLKTREWFDAGIKEGLNRTPLTEVLNAKYQVIKHLPGIKIEIIGVWLWISGNTKPVKDQLNNAGFKWNFKKCMWSWHEAGYRKRSKKQFNIDQIREMFGSEDLESSEYSQVA